MACGPSSPDSVLQDSHASSGTCADSACCESSERGGKEASGTTAWNASEFQCSVCYELLLDPVVGSCGHDFCKHCIDEWRVSRQQAGQTVQCPICRAVLLSSSDQSFGVCIRLRETIEKLFSHQIAARRKQVSLGAAQPLAKEASANSPALPDGPAAPRTPSWLDENLFHNAQQQYMELGRLVSAITSMPPPPAPLVHALSRAATALLEQQQAANNGQLQLSPQQQAELAGLYLMSPQLAAAAQLPGAHTGTLPNNGVVQAALTLLTSAAATSTAASHLSSLVAALQASHHLAANAAYLQATALNLQQLTAETAAFNSMLRAQYNMQQAQAQVQAQAHAQAHYVQSYLAGQAPYWHASQVGVMAPTSQGFAAAPPASHLPAPGALLHPATASMQPYAPASGPGPVRAAWQHSQLPAPACLHAGPASFLGGATPAGRAPGSPRSVAAAASSSVSNTLSTGQGAAAPPPALMLERAEGGGSSGLAAARLMNLLPGSRYVLDVESDLQHNAWRPPQS